MNIAEYVNDYISHRPDPKDRADNGEITTFEGDEYARCALAEKFSYTYIAYHTYYRRLSPEVHSYSTARTRMIGALRVQGKCSLKRLCDILYISRSNGSIMIEKLVEQGLVNRVPDLLDRRKVLLSLTPEGEKVADEMLQEEICAYYQQFKVFSKEDMERLSDAFDTVVELLGKIDLDREE